MVKVLECGARGPGFNPHPKEKKIFLFQMDIEEVEVIKDHRPIGHGPFFRRRSMGPLPSSCIDVSQASSKYTTLPQICLLMARYISRRGVGSEACQLIIDLLSIGTACEFN